MKKNKFTSVLGIGLLTFLLWFSITCRSSDTDNKALNTEVVAINVTLAHDDYEDVANKNIQASNNNFFLLTNNQVQTREVSFEGGFDLVAELKPDISSLKSTKQASLNPIAVATPIQRAIKFRVVVYNSSGEYDSSYNYSVSTTGAITPDSGNPIKLNGGQSYTFIAYSYNTNTAPADDLTGSNLNTATISVVSPQDIMYYKTTMTPSGNPGAQNNLNIVLKHSFSTITVNIDSSLTNYNITNITGATLGKAFSTATIALNSGMVNSSGTAGAVNVNFPASPNSNNISAIYAVIVNNTNNINDGVFNISSLTVGPLTGTNVAFNNLTIQPGVRYTMTIKLVPQDVFFDDTTSVPGITIKAARIGGKVWMRHNLGADINLDPDQNPSVPGLHGSYYQWGKITSVADAYTPPGDIPGWDSSTISDIKSWNDGTEDQPKKTRNDPCPNGYRVPTSKEFNALINATISPQSSNIGTWSQSASNYSAAKVFRSKRNANIQLTFPMTGLRAANTGNLLTNSLNFPSRGLVTCLWASLRNNNKSSEMDIYENSIDGNSGSINTSWGMPIRCIAL